MNQQSEANPLSNKINKILNSQLDQESIDALKGVSQLVNINTIGVRRNLRSSIEKQSLIINQQFVDSFSDVNRCLESLYNDVNQMNNCCQQMIKQIEMTRSETSHLLHKTNELKGELNQIEIKQIIVNGFLNAFQLKPEEVAILQGSGSNNPNNNSTVITDDNINQKFFDVLNRVQKIHEHAKVLLMNDQQTTGIEIMDSMALYEEAAYERLYRWTLSILRSLSSDQIDIHPQLFPGMACLQKREILFKNCLEEYVTVRRSAIVRNFIDALTRGGPTGTPSAIESHSNDLIRYVGDMLAFLHQSIASEKEMIDILFKHCDQQSIKDSQLIEISLSSITEGLSRPLKVRVEQSLISEQSTVSGQIKIGPSVYYRVKNLLNFYQHTMKQTLLNDAQLIYTIKELHLLSNRMFFNSLNYYCVSRKTSTDIESPPDDLRASHSVVQTVALLKEVLCCRDSCLVSNDERNEEVPQILSTVIDPLIQSCIISASKLTAIEMAVFLFNCLHTIWHELPTDEFTARHKDNIKKQIDSHVHTITDEQVSHIIAYLGVSQLYNIISSPNEDIKLPVSSLSGCDPLAIRSSMIKMDTFIASPTALMLHHINNLINEETKNKIWKQSLETICAIYEQIYILVNEPKNNYEHSTGLMHYQPQQIKMLLL